MSHYTFSSAGCWLSRCQKSPAAHFLHQHRRTMITLATTPTTSSSPIRARNSVQPIPYFLLPSRSPQPRRHEPQHLLPPLPRGEQRSARFSTTSSRKATIVSLNPRVDEDGNEMAVKISDRAAKRLRDITKPSAGTSSLSNEGSYDHLRVTVTSGGCHGFQYLMSLDPSSKVDPEEDTIFEAGSESSDEADGGTAKVVMDLASLEILQGSTIDYTVELIGSQFNVVDNPRATSNCGCGTSFDVKE